MPTRVAWTIASLLIGASAGVARAQDTLQAPVGSVVAYAADSGVVANAGDVWTVVYAHDVKVQGAAWLRVHFDAAHVRDGAIIRVTSLLDAEVQELDAARLEMWGRTTAYFNGDAVRVEIVAPPGSSGHRVAIRQVEAEVKATPGFVGRGGSGQCGICGNDDRVPSAELWSGRVMPVGCTGSIVCEDSVMISAGHCVAANQVIQFNVPPSSASCTTANPPVNDQFPVVVAASSNAGVGNDWAVYTCGVNGLGQTPYQRYGQLKRLAAGVATVSAAVNFNGYGLDLSCGRSQTQQLSEGAVSVVASNHYQFAADLRGGNSGSGLLSNNFIIGVVSHCSVGCPNYATRVDLPAFRTAINNAMACDGYPIVTWTSVGAAALITLTPLDIGGQGSGVTPFTRQYAPATVLSARAPATVETSCFRGWRVDNIDLGLNPGLWLAATRTFAVETRYMEGPCCIADRDDGTGTGIPDGAVDISDLLYYIGLFGEGNIAGDIDDGTSTGTFDRAVDISDLLFYLARFSAGC